jgi:dienelactone hydrolase
MSEVGSAEPRDEQYLDPGVVSKVRFQAIDNKAHTLATAVLTRRWRTAGETLRRTTLAQDGFIGCYWSPVSTSRRTPAILSFGGSEGGLNCGTGILAAHGYPELTIGYFGLTGLPKHLHRIPLEYFEKAIHWLDRQPGVDSKRIVAWGVSRGGEAAFLLGTTYPQLVDAVVDYVGGNTAYGGVDVPGPAWTLHGRGIKPGTTIPIQKIAGPLFMVGGWDDQLFESGLKVEEMATQLQAAHKHNFTALAYANAGHAIGEAVPNLRPASASSTTTACRTRWAARSRRMPAPARIRGRSCSRSWRSSELRLDHLPGRREHVPETAVQVQRLTLRLAGLRVDDIRVERPLVVRHDLAAGRVLVAADQLLFRRSGRDGLLTRLQLDGRPDGRADRHARDLLLLVRDEHVERQPLAVDEHGAELRDLPCADLDGRGRAHRQSGGGKGESGQNCRDSENECLSHVYLLACRLPWREPAKRRAKATCL